MTYYEDRGALYNNLFKSNFRGADELALLDAARVENTSGCGYGEDSHPPRVTQSKKSTKEVNIRMGNED